MATRKTEESKPKLTVAERVAAMYSKDKSVQTILKGSTLETKVYKREDGVPLPVGHPLAELTGLPCIPFGKVAQLAGKPDTGKSTMSGEVAAEAQRAGFEVVLWDSEDKMDANRFETEFGGIAAKLHPIKTNEIRKGGQLVKDYITVIKEENPDAKILVVWDSVGGSISRSETERNLTDEKHGQPGQDAKETGQVIRHILGMCNKYPNSIAILLVNQTYARIGFMVHGDAAKGGVAIEFHSSLIIFLKRIKVLTKTVNKRKVKEGIITRATVTKNHLSQGKNSTYQQDFAITSAGTKVSELELGDDEDDE